MLLGWPCKSDMKVRSLLQRRLGALSRVFGPAARLRAFSVVPRLSIVISNMQNVNQLMITVLYAFSSVHSACLSA